jgi:hypothetical protein
MSRLATQYGLSGNGLAEICRRLNVPYPPRGYWAGKAAGKKVVQTALPAIRPGLPPQVTIAPSLPASPSRQMPAELEHALTDARRMTAGLKVPGRLANDAAGTITMTETKPTPTIVRIDLRTHPEERLHSITLSAESHDAAHTLPGRARVLLLSAAGTPRPPRFNGFANSSDSTDVAAGGPQVQLTVKLVQPHSPPSTLKLWRTFVFGSPLPWQKRLLKVS